MTTTEHKIDVERIKQNNDLVEIAGRYTELRRNSAADMHGPCPLCGDGGHGFHVKQDWFVCYKCSATGDMIHFLELKCNVEFPQAVAMLNDKAAMPLAERSAPRPQTPKRTGPSFDVDKKLADVEHDHRRLLDANDSEAEAGRKYLLKRGLLENTWLAFKLGFDPAVPLTNTWDEKTSTFVYPKQPAIVIPWFRRGKLVAVRYRYLQAHTYTDISGEERTEKTKSLYGSWFGSGVLYGGHAFVGSTSSMLVLIIVEGELNACSIWQVAKDSGVHVLSIGSESAKLSDDDIARIKQYGTIIVWLDDEKFVRQITDNIPGAYGVKSLIRRDENNNPLLDKKGKPQKLDANDLLVSGQLSGLLALHRFQAAKDRSEQERLLDQLWTAVQLPGGDSDAGLMEVVSYIAKTLDRELAPRCSLENEMSNMVQPPTEGNVKPPLPPELWVSGLSQNDAWQRFYQLKQKYQCAFGCDRKDFTYYVAAPGKYVKDRPTHCVVKAIMTIR